jgi:hypothetical protein
MMTRSNESFIISLSEELENDEVLRLFESCDFCCSITEENVIDRLYRHHRCHHEIFREVSFIASHIENISVLSLKKLDYSVISMILSSGDIKIPSEDWLLNVISELVEEDEEYIGLFEYVGFEWVSVSCMERFCEIGANFISELNLGIWRRLFGRCVLPVSPSGRNERVNVKVSGKPFPVQRECPLEGIISYLTKKSGGNVADLGVIGVSASSEYDYSVPAKHASYLDNRDVWFLSKNSAGSWFCYDFKAMRITPTHYTIISDLGGRYLRNWCLEVSNDGVDWTSIDERRNCEDLCDRGKIGTYDVSKSVTCRYIRLRHTGPNAYSGSEKNCLGLTGLEIFGYLHEV